MPKLSIIIIPGSFAAAAIYDPLVEAVTARGYEILAVQLPSVGLKPEPTPAQESSYGGVPATESVRGLAKAHRQDEGKEVGIVRLAYMSALAPELGVAAGGVLADATRAEETRIDMEMDVGLGSLLHSPPPFPFQGPTLCLVSLRA